MAKLKFKDENNEFIPVVQDVKVNNNSVFDGKDADIKLKTVNNQSIVGEGNINIDTSGTYEELPDKPSINDVELIGNKTSQDLGLADDGDINNLQSQIDAITVSSDVVDVLGTYQDLLDYDTSELGDNDIVKVLQDSTHGDAMSYYRWDKTNEEWDYVGSEGPFYTKSESNTLLNAKANTADLSTVAFTGKYKDLIDNPVELLNVNNYTTLTTLLQNFENEGKEFGNYEAENFFLLRIENDNYDSLAIFPGDIIKISAIDYTAIIITGNGAYYYWYDTDTQQWNTEGNLLNENQVDSKLSQAATNFVTTNTDQDITGMKTIRANNGLRFRYGSNYIRMAIKPTSEGMAISYFNAQGSEANNMEFNQGYNRSNKHFVPKDDKTQNLGKSDQVWNNGYINTLSDGTNSITVENIVGKQDALTFDSTPTLNSTNPVTSGGVYNSIQNVIEVAEGKTATYTLSYDTTGNADFNSQNNSITVSSFVDTAGNTITDEDVKVGDIVLIVEVDVPDRWVQSIDTTNHTITFYKMETSKIDLTNYVDLTSDQTIGGNKTFSDRASFSGSSYTGYIKNSENALRFFYGGSVKFKIGTNYVTPTQNFIPNANNSQDLGSSSYKWKDFYIAGNLSDGTNQTSVENINNNFAPIYDSTSTYAVGDKVIYQGRLYECNTAISTAEAWDSTKWTAINVIGEIPTNYLTTDTAQDISAIKTHTANINLKNNVSIKLGNSYSNGYSLCNDGSGGLSFKNNYNVVKYSMVDNYFTSQANSNLGTSGKLWKDLYLSGKLTDGTNEVTIADLKALIDYAKAQGWIS